MMNSGNCCMGALFLLLLFPACKWRSEEDTAKGTVRSSWETTTEEDFGEDYSFSAYIAECEETIGLPPDALSCDGAGSIAIPVLPIDPARPEAGCRNPHTVSGRCTPGGSLTVGLIDDDADRLYVLECSRALSGDELDEGEVNVVNLILHRKSTGETCFFGRESLEGIPGRNIARPGFFKSGHQIFVPHDHEEHPNCVSCHASKPFLFSPYLLTYKLFEAPADPRAEVAYQALRNSKRYVVLDEKALNSLTGSSDWSPRKHLWSLELDEGDYPLLLKQLSGGALSGEPPVNASAADLRLALEEVKNCQTCHGEGLPGMTFQDPTTRRGVMSENLRLHAQLFGVSAESPALARENQSVQERVKRLVVELILQCRNFRGCPAQNE